MLLLVQLPLVQLLQLLIVPQVMFYLLPLLEILVKLVLILMQLPADKLQLLEFKDYMQMLVKQDWQNVPQVLLQ